MRIIPKKIKVKNTVWKCYSMKDILLALVLFAISDASVVFPVPGGPKKIQLPILSALIAREISELS